MRLSNFKFVKLLCLQILTFPSIINVFRNTLQKYSLPILAGSFDNSVSLLYLIVYSVHFDMTLISCWGILTDKIQVRRRVFQWRLFPVSFLFLVFSYPVMSSSCSDTIYHAYHIIGKESCMLAWHSIEGDKIVSIFKMNYWCRGRFCDFHEKTDGRALLLRSVSNRKVNIKNNGFNRIIMYCPDPLRYFRSSLILLKQVRELC